MAAVENGVRAALCPSHPCEEGARLIGIVQRDGTVAFTPERYPYRCCVRGDREARAHARSYAFDLRGACQRGRCMQWTGERCGIIDGVLRDVAEHDVAVAAALPDCAIRKQCRWYMQAGERACRACPLVMTQMPSAARE